MWLYQQLQDAWERRDDIMYELIQQKISHLILVRKSIEELLLLLDDSNECFVMYVDKINKELWVRH